MGVGRLHSLADLVCDLNEQSITENENTERTKRKRKNCRTKHIRTFNQGSNSTLGQMDDKWLKWSPVIQ